MRSHLLEGRVHHRRLRPFDYRLGHGVWYVGLDLDEIDAVIGRLRLVARNRRHVLGFHDADHLTMPAPDVASGIREHLRGSGIDHTGLRLTLITNLRVLGYVFNPASFVLGHDADGHLAVVVVEVHNTHGERHLYTLRPGVGLGEGEAASGSAGSPFRAGMAKAFYVSPFLEMAGRYVVHVREDADRLSIAIEESQGETRMLSTSLVLRRRPLTDAGLLRMLVRYPFVTHKTIAMIHWHALRLWLKGARFLRHGEAGGVVGRHPEPARDGVRGTGR